MSEHYHAAGRAIADLHLCISWTRCALEAAEDGVKREEAIEESQFALARELEAREKCARFGKRAVRMAEHYATLHRRIVVDDDEN